MIEDSNTKNVQKLLEENSNFPLSASRIAQELLLPITKTLHCLLALKKNGIVKENQKGEWYIK